MMRITRSCQFPKRCYTTNTTKNSDADKIQNILKTIKLINDKPMTPKSNSSNSSSNSSFTSQSMFQRSATPHFKDDNFASELFTRSSRPNWEKETLVPVVKSTYDPHPEVKNMDNEEAEQWRMTNGVKIEGKGSYNPILSFDQTPFVNPAKNYLKSKYTQPTVIQSQSWPIALDGRDMVGGAETGSGKTLGFILPAFEHISKQEQIMRERNDGPIALVLAPTRELVDQIHKEAQDFCHLYQSKRIAAVYGGTGNRFLQLRNLERQPHLVVATPGRLMDFLSINKTNLKRTSFVVLDEADRMLDMGFEPQIRAILEHARPDRQTLMWSATWPKKVEALARDYFKQPLKIIIGEQELRANQSITQTFYFCNHGDKLEHLCNVVQQFVGSKILIFSNQKKKVEELAFFLDQYSRKFNLHLKTAVLHGDVTQSVRSNVLAQMKKGELDVLLATDLAARGLDVKDIGLVINYDMPKEIDTYIHRIGRTGRAGNEGVSLSYFTNEDYPLGKDLLTVLKHAKQDIPEELTQFEPRSGGRFQGTKQRY